MLPPQGAAPQQQVQGGIPAAPQAPKGAAPQMAKQGAGKADPKQVEILRASPRVKQAIELFMGRPVDMAQVPDDLLVEVAGMVAKLGVQGAVAMATKMIPQEVQKQLKQQVPNGNAQ